MDMTDSEMEALKITENRFEEKARLDMKALKIIGLTEEEICIVERFFGKPTPAGVADKERYAMWALEYLPRTNGLGMLDKFSYVKSVSILDYVYSNGVYRWLDAAESAWQDEGGSLPELIKIVRKVAAWCRNLDIRTHLQDGEKTDHNRKPSANPVVKLREIEKSRQIDLF